MAVFERLRDGPKRGFLKAVTVRSNLKRIFDYQRGWINLGKIKINLD